MSSFPDLPSPPSPENFRVPARPSLYSLFSTTLLLYLHLFIPSRIRHVTRSQTPLLPPSVQFRTIVRYLPITNRSTPILLPTTSAELHAMTWSGIASSQLSEIIGRRPIRRATSQTNILGARWKRDHQFS